VPADVKRSPVAAPTLRELRRNSRSPTTPRLVVARCRDTASRRLAPGDLIVEVAQQESRTRQVTQINEAKRAPQIVLLLIDRAGDLRSSLRIDQADEKAR